MAKIIKHHVKTKSEYQFKVGDHIKWYMSYHDGRVTSSLTYYGTVVKVHPVNLHVEDKEGNIWTVNKIKEAMPITKYEFRTNEYNNY